LRRISVVLAVRQLRNPLLLRETAGCRTKIAENGREDGGPAFHSK
jgi:hypothetical protein